MATVSAARASSTFPVGGNVCFFDFGTFEIASALSAADIVEFKRLPKCSVVAGFLQADDIDTGTEVLEFDVGHAGNGTDAADPDAFLNSGAITGDAILGHKPEVAIHIPFMGLLKDGPLALAETTLCQGVVTVAANAGGTGTITAGFWFLRDFEGQ